MATAFANSPPTPNANTLNTFDLNVLAGKNIMASMNGIIKGANDKRIPIAIPRHMPLKNKIGNGFMQRIPLECRRNAKRAKRMDGVWFQT